METKIPGLSHREQVFLQPVMSRSQRAALRNQKRQALREEEEEAEEDQQEDQSLSVN